MGCPRCTTGPFRLQAGFGLIETLMGVASLALALMAYVATTLSHQRLAEESTTRTEIHQVAREFVERLRGDAEWSTLYQRLRARQIEASVAGLTGTRFDDGRLGFPLTDYHEGIEVPAGLRSMVVLVDVPSAPDASGTNVLREDVSSPRYGLPADLNGDGKIDAQARDEDYVALPIVVMFRWVPRGEGSRELRIATFLRGDR